MNGNVFVTRRIPQPGIDRMIEAGLTVEVNPEERVLEPRELREKVKGRDAVLCLLTDPINREVIEAADRCRIIANYAVGYNNIDVAFAVEKGIVVTNTPGVLTDATADLAWALLMATARQLVSADRYLREGRFHQWEPMTFLGMDLAGKTLGILGPGRIGRAVAKRSTGWDMRVLFCGRRESETSVSLDTLLRESDFLSIHVPLNESTHHLIGPREFSRMKPTAILINTSRGPVVDEKALVEALRSGTIAGAGLDVYEHEPRVEPGLLQLDNVVLLPHIGSATTGTRTRMALMAAENIVACLGGRQPPNRVG